MHFGSQEVRRAEKQVAFFVLLNVFREAKIDYTQCPILVYQAVLRLHISVNDIVRVNVMQGTEKTLHEMTYTILWK